MKEKILVVDDEYDIANLVGAYLKSENYSVCLCYNARETLEQLEKESFDLAVIDLMLPDMDGFTLCQQIREKYTFPIIMLTARSEQTDKITGLTLGADDYITKPFQPLELVARAKAQLRRYKRYNPALENTLPANVLSSGGLILDTSTYECQVDGRELSLTPTEFSILRILLEHKGSVVSAEDIFHQLWQEEYYSKSNNTISVHIRHLREKMKDSAEDPRYIKTVWGVGYKVENK